MVISNKEQLLPLLSSEHCEYKLYEHPPVFTVAEATQHCRHIPGAHVKNLFLRNHKKTAYWLITVKEDKRVDLRTLGDRLATGRLSFASPADLIAMLGIQPGSVTPLAIINDQAKRIKLLFDADLLDEKNISVHPMENTATITLQFDELLRFIENYRQEKIGFIEIPNLIQDYMEK